MSSSVGSNMNRRWTVQAYWIEISTTVEAEKTNPGSLCRSKTLQMLQAEEHTLTVSNRTTQRVSIIKVRNDTVIGRTAVCQFPSCSVGGTLYSCAPSYCC